MSKRTRPKICAVAVLTFLGSTAWTATFFSEDFNSYTNDGEMAAAGWISTTLDQLPPGDPLRTTVAPVETCIWTLRDGGSGPHGNRANPLDRYGRNTSGNCVIADSDAQAGDDQGVYDAGFVLETPVIDCSSAANVWLHFASFIALNNNGHAVFEIWVSPDNGATWNGIEQRVGTDRTAPPLADAVRADGIAGTVDYYITPHAAGQSQVKIRFIDRGNSWDWFFLLDDIVVDDVPSPMGEVDLLPVESFLAGTIPGTWSVTTNCGNNPWHIHDPARPGERQHISEAGGVAGERIINRLDLTFAILDSDQDPDDCNDIEYLDTPAVDASGMSMIYLHFDSEVLPDGPATEEVLVSVDGGTTFLPDPVWTYENVPLNVEDPKFTHHDIPVPLAAGQSSVIFRFSYLGDGNRWYWAVDNIRVTGSAIGFDPPATPTLILQPPYSVIDAQAGIVMATSAYDDGGQGLPHVRTDFQLRRVSGSWSNPYVAGSVTSGDMTQFTVGGLVKPNETWVVRARHVGHDAGAGIDYPSAWSTEATFTVEPPPNTVLVLSEDFDILQSQLQPAVDETGIPPDLLGFTHNPPGAWAIDNSRMELGGTEEWKGWSFATLEFWVAAQDQDRSNFTWADGVLAIADSDEYDDFGPGPTGFDSILISMPISVPADAAVYVFYDVHYRQEAPAIGEFRISVGGVETVVKRYDTETQNTLEFFTLPAATSPRVMFFLWEYFGDETTADGLSRNNWYFALDNLQVYVESTGGPLSVRNTWSLYE